VRAVSLARVAAEAELLRIQHMLKRQGLRAAFGVIAAVFAVDVLVLCNVAGWQVLRWYVQPIYATLVLLGINTVVMAVVAALAARSSPATRSARHSGYDNRRSRARAALSP
jgi:hypothetical protein